MSYPHSLAPSSIDFIRSDFDALASHMQQCETAHGRWPMARSHLQHARAMAAGRIVTLACVAVLIGIGFAIAA
jgi:adenylosuccinate lyase